MPAGWAAAAGAAISAGEGIASSQAAAGAAKKNEANVSELSGAQNTMLNQAEANSNQAFTTYTGTLVAPMSGNQQAAYSLAGADANGTSPAAADFAKGSAALDSVTANPWNAATASKYMNPYTQSVTDAALAQQNKTYLQGLATLQTGEGATSSFGNARNAIEESNLTASNALNAGSLTATNNAAAYDTAMKSWEADNNTKISAANAYANAGNDVTNMTNDQISNLLKTGGTAQVIAQTNLDSQYQQFLRQQGWSAQQLGPLISAVSSAKGSNTYSPPVQSNTANQLLGLGSTIAGLAGGSGSSNPTGLSFSTSNTGAADEYAANSVPVTSYSPSLSGAATGAGIDGGSVGGGSGYFGSNF
jgi:hypothetical protein